jgi:hypothetical protein
MSVRSGATPTVRRGRMPSGSRPRPSTSARRAAHTAETRTRAASSASAVPNRPWCGAIRWQRRQTIPSACWLKVDLGFVPAVRPPSPTRKGGSETGPSHPDSAQRHLRKSIAPVELMLDASCGPGGRRESKRRTKIVSLEGFPSTQSRSGGGVRRLQKGNTADGEMWRRGHVPSGVVADRRSVRCKLPLAME